MDIIFDSMKKSENTGAVIRLASATGCTIHFTGPSIHFSVRGVRRASVGCDNTANIKYWDTLSELIEKFKNENRLIIATTLTADTEHWDIEYPEDVVLLFGNEVRGLQPEQVKLCDKEVKIPMPGIAESLNVAVSSGIIIYEALRQQNILMK